MGQAGLKTKGRQPNAKMKPEKNYVSGEHHYKTRFWCGMVAGGGLGAWIGGGLFQSGWLVLAFSVGASVVCGLMADHWRDGFWDFVLELLTSFWWWW